MAVNLFCCISNPGFRLLGGMTPPPPIFSNLPESWSKVCHAGRELATAFSVIPFRSNNSWSIGQLVNWSKAPLPPPTENVLAHHRVYYIKIWFTTSS